MRPTIYCDCGGLIFLDDEDTVVCFCGRIHPPVLPLPPDPDGCKFCGHPERGHGRVYTLAPHPDTGEDIGWHSWAEPTDAQRLERMKQRSKWRVAAWKQHNQAPSNEFTVEDGLDISKSDSTGQRVWRFSYENGHAIVELGGVRVSSLTANGESWVRRTELDSLYDSLRTLAEDWTHEATKEPMAMAKRPWIAAVRDLKKLLGPRGDTTERNGVCEHGISWKYMPYTHYSIYHKEDHP